MREGYFSPEFKVKVLENSILFFLVYISAPISYILSNIDSEYCLNGAIPFFYMGLLFILVQNIFHYAVSQPKYKMAKYFLTLNLIIVGIAAGYYDYTI